MEITKVKSITADSRRGVPKAVGVGGRVRSQGDIDHRTKTSVEQEEYFNRSITYHSDYS